MRSNRQPFAPSWYDLEKMLLAPSVRYMLVKADKILSEERMRVLSALRSALWTQLIERPVVRLWPDQWLAEEWARYAGVQVRRPQASR